MKQGHVILDNLPVCSSLWTDKNAKVACRQMGFSNGGVYLANNATKPSNYHQKSFDCSGLEQNLLSCPMVDSTSCKGQQSNVTCTGKLVINLGWN